MSGKRWSRLTLRAQKDRWGGVHTMLCTALPAYQPGDEVVVMPAADADEMLRLLRYFVARVPDRHPLQTDDERKTVALLERLTPGPGDKEGR